MEYMVMKKILRPFSLSRWFRKSSCQLLVKECELNTGKLPRRLVQEHLSRNIVVRVTDHAQNDLKCIKGP